MKKIFLLILLILGILGLTGCSFDKIADEKDSEKKEIINYNDYYFDNVKLLNDKTMYIKDTEFKKYGTLYKDSIISLEKDDNFENGYFKIKDSNYYINYQDLEESEELVEDLYWNNYIPFNLSIKMNDKTDLYKNNKLVVTINDSLTLPIIIKEDEYYGVSYKNKLYYVKKSDGEVIDNINTDLKYTESIAALTYHFVYDSSNNEEKNKCLKMNSVICLSDTLFDSHMKYIKDNGYYTATMKDIEMFVDKKVQLPEHTVLLTIDDGNFVSASIKVLEKYDLHATLFLIGIAGSPDNYKSSNLEIHSHTWNMHNGGICPGGQGSEIKCLPKEQILEDLKKSQESLNNTPYFCWPFFEYNDYAINILKEAGFRMAFIGGRRKIKPGMDKMILPRYGVVNDTMVSDIARIIS